MDDDPFNLTDIHRKPTGKDGLAVVTGFLIVGYKKTEKEFSAIYGGDRSKLPPDEVIFEDADGNVETSSPRKSTNLYDSQP